MADRAIPTQPPTRTDSRLASNGKPAATPHDVSAVLGIGPATNRGAAIARRSVRWVVLIALVAVGVAYWRLRGGAPPVRYETMAARRGDLSVTVTETGTLAALDTVDVGTEVSGVIDVVAVDYNDRVRAGETLAVVNTDQLRAQIQQAEAALQAAEANAAVTAATLAETKPQADRSETLYVARAISTQDVEGTRAALARAAAADANARAQVGVATAALEALRTQLAKATIRSPIAGVVLQRQIEPGRTVAASFQTPVLFVLAADLRRMTLALDVDEADVGSVRAGQDAEFTVDAYPDRTFTGRVRSVRNAAKTVEGVVTYQAILDVRNPDLALRPGMTATAAIKTDHVHDALLVPNAALRFTPMTDTASTASAAAASRRPGGRQVWLLRSGAPVAVSIATGASDGQWTEVKSGAIEVGTPLLTGIASTVSSPPADTSRRASRGPLPIPRGR